MDLVQYTMIVFDGYTYAARRERELLPEVAKLKTQGVVPKVVAILFQEDQGSQLYTRLKSEAATRLGIEYQVQSFSLRTPVSEIAEAVKAANADPLVTGIIIQKPWRQTWVQVSSPNHHDGDQAGAFKAWWHELVSLIDPAKDVDGLHPSTLELLAANAWSATGKVLPATCLAVWEILEESKQLSPEKQIVIIGKSDLLGLPLYYWLRHHNYKVELWGKAELAARRESGQLLQDKDIVISATGQPGLITGDLLKPGVTLVDVGEPRADIDRASLSETVAFLTPVPGGVGPVTVSCLMANAVTLASQKLTTR